jgi:phosphoenolpyruvate---glycerone phosphotransferase subunit DhaL
MNQDIFKNWIIQANIKIQENKDYLSDLDRAIGDGDHGVNLARGFQEAAKNIADTEFPDIGAMFLKVAFALIGKVGGASGPLYGTAFLKLGNALKGKTECPTEELVDALGEALIGIKTRGHAEVGEKTMVDVWEPVIQKWKSELSTADIDELRDFTKSCMEKTKEMEARKGRAAYLGKRSVGTFDPGAVSSYLLLDALFCELKGATP